MSDRWNKDFLNDVEKLYNKYSIDYDGIKNAIDNLARKERHNEIINKTRENLDLVGKCYKLYMGHSRFPDMYKYYKVLSIQSENEYRVECLTFYEHPTYWFDTKLSIIGVPGNGYLGNFELYTVEVESIMAKDLRNKEYSWNHSRKFEEISLEEYNVALRKHYEELINAEWITDHARTCDTLPTDPKWKKVKDDG